MLPLYPGKESNSIQSPVFLQCGTLAATGGAQQADHFTVLNGKGQMIHCCGIRALIKEPKILLLDEPFSNLDARLLTGLDGD